MNGTGVWGIHGMIQIEEDRSIPRKLVPIPQKKSHLDWAAIELKPSLWQTGDY